MLLVQADDFPARNLHASSGCRQDAAHDREQSSLSASRGPHQHDHFSGVDFEIDAAECDYTGFSFGVRFG